MIFLLGTNSHKIKDGAIENVVCPSCKCTTKLKYSVYSRYTHITYIPFFPVEKNAKIYCNACENEIDLKDIDDKTISRLACENDNLKNPIWMFFCSFAIMVCIIYGVYVYLKSDNKTALLIKNPMIEDVYYMKDSKGYYYTLRIDSTSSDSIYTTENDYQVDAPYDIDDINLPENYTKQRSSFTKKELVKLYDLGKIISIKRQ